MFTASSTQRHASPSSTSCEVLFIDTVLLVLFSFLVIVFVAPARSDALLDMQGLNSPVLQKLFRYWPFVSFSIHSPFYLCLMRHMLY